LGTLRPADVRSRAPTVKAWERFDELLGEDLRCRPHFEPDEFAGVFVVVAESPLVLLRAYGPVRRSDPDVDDVALDRVVALGLYLGFLGYSRHALMTRAVVSSSPSGQL
jgi:hypothetical protein